MTGESRDGEGTGDHNQPYEFGNRLTPDNTAPFSARQFARLQCLRSHVQDGERVPDVWVFEHPERFGLPVLATP